MTEQPETPDVEPQEYDASDPKTVNNARKRAARFKYARRNFIQRMMESEDGRLWMYKLLNFDCHIFTTSFVPLQPDVSTFRAGEQHVGHKILEDIMEISPDNFILMCKEGREEKWS